MSDRPLRLLSRMLQAHLLLSEDLCISRIVDGEVHNDPPPTPHLAPPRLMPILPTRLWELPAYIECR